MEITSGNPLREAGAARPPQKREGRSPAAPVASAARDKLELSRQALAFVERLDAQAKARYEELMRGTQEKRSCLTDLLQMMDDSQESAKAAAERLKVLDRCQKISAAIMRGDRVPPEDEQYLMEHQPEMYKLSVAMRRPKEDPEDCKSVLEDEEESGGGKASASPESGAPSPEAPAPEAPAPTPSACADGGAGG